MKLIFEMMRIAFAHGEMFYENDTKENIVVPILCGIKGKLGKRIFRDCPDGSADEGRRWDLQLSKKRLSTDGGWSDVLECKRISNDLRKRRHSPQDVEKWVADKKINGRGDPFLQVFLCKKSGKFIEADRVWLTNGVKWFAFDNSFFDKWVNPHRDDLRGADLNEKQYCVADFADAVKKGSFSLWMDMFRQLRDAFKQSTRA